jgi:hypothetical protein
MWLEKAAMQIDDEQCGAPKYPFVPRIGFRRTRTQRRGTQ